MSETNTTSTNELKLGPGLRFLVIVLSTCLLLGLGFAGGTVYNKFKQEESNVEVINNDSIEVQNISKQTRELKNEIDEWLKYNDPIDGDGNPNPEWLQLMESQKSIAEQRGDQTSIIRKITKM